MVLATIVFDTLQTGTSPLRFSRAPLVLSNSFGQELAITPTEGSITIVAVPEPASMLLCGAALCWRPQACAGAVDGISSAALHL